MQSKTGSTTLENLPKPQLTATILIDDLVGMYPEVAEVLINEYGFHCVGCFASQFDTLQSGAMVHGIQGADFAELLARLQQIVNKSA